MLIDKIICAGKNYTDHVLEMGDKKPEKPVIFIKPASVLKQAQHWQESLDLELPKDRGSVHHECEIVLRLNQDAYQINVDQAKMAISHVSIGLDMTLRDLQQTLKNASSPWTIAKVFKDSAAVGPWIAIDEFENFLEREFSLTIDDTVRQRAKGSTMITDPYTIVAYMSQCFPLCKGDIIFTGTPSGVGPVYPGSVGTLSWADYSYTVKWR